MQTQKAGQPNSEANCNPTLLKMVLSFDNSLLLLLSNKSTGEHNQKQKLSATTNKRTTNIPYVTNYLPLQRNELKKIAKEKTHINQELVKASGVFS